MPERALGSRGGHAETRSPWQGIGLSIPGWEPIQCRHHYQHDSGPLKGCTAMYSSPSKHVKDLWLTGTSDESVSKMTTGQIIFFPLTTRRFLQFLLTKCFALHTILLKPTQIGRELLLLWLRISYKSQEFGIQRSYFWLCSIQLLDTYTCIMCLNLNRSSIFPLESCFCTSQTPTLDHTSRSLTLPSIAYQLSQKPTKNPLLDIPCSPLT